MGVSTGDIQSARTAASSAQGRAGELAAYQPSVADAIKQKALEAYNYNQDLVKPLDTATSDYLQSPNVAREKYQDVFNPFSREKLVGQYTQNQSLPMLSLASILGQRFGGIGNIIQSGANAYSAQAGAAQNQANTAQNYYTNLMNEYKMTQPEPNQWLDLGNKKVMVDANGNIVQSLGIGQSPGTASGDGGGGGDLSSIINALIGSGGGAGVTPTESKPMYTPPQKGATSRGGEWYFAGSEYYPDDWIPIVD
jgi:hypothetical protein